MTDAQKFATIEDAELIGMAFGLTASLVGEEPQEAQLRAFVENEVFVEAPFANDNANVVTGLQKLSAWCADFAQLEPAAATEAAGALRRVWFRLFVGAGVPDSPCWATYYSDPNKQIFGRETLAVRAAYASLGVRVEKSGSEPDDHLMYMLRFLGYALSQEAQAAAAGDTEQAERHYDLQRDFVVEHILPWITRWAYVAQRDAANAYYEGVAYLTFGFIEEYAKRFGIIFNEENRSFVQKRA